MKKIISKINRKLHNAGSSIVLVIVALAFVGILTGALLTAVAYAYRQKLYDYNAKSNFYYLDQAMDEIYAGVGSKTMSSLTEAYEKTRENIIEFKIDTQTYKTIDNNKANLMFKNKFMEAVSSGDFTVIRRTGEDTYEKYNGTSWEAATSTEFKDSIVYDMENMISDSKVTLDSSKMSLKYVYIDGTTGQPKEYYTKATSFGTLSKIVIKNVKLTRSVEYSRSMAKGEFNQSISTDIEISRPDFEVNFGNNTQDVSTLFDYCMIADSGVDFNRIGGDVLTINGNIYAANDFYNKAYNNYDNLAADDSRNLSAKEYTDSNGVKYKMNKVSNYTYSSTDPSSTNLYNKNINQFNIANINTEPTNKADLIYDGANDKSKYSGLYIDGGTVNILANTIIVPGSISVMNGGKLSVYGMSSSDAISRTDVWADEIILGGYSIPTIGSSADPEKSRKGSEAAFNANLYVLDDTQIESEYSKFKVSGNYFGYSNSAAKDQRVFLPTVKKSSDFDDVNVYQHRVVNADGSVDIENKGHFNSSSILVNGQYSNIDLSGIEKLYIAGRAYIELSNIKSNSTVKYADKKKTQNDTYDASTISEDDKVDYNYKTYQFEAEMDDYKTGESVSIKSSQLGYYPGKASGSLDEDGKHFTLTTGTANSGISTMRLFTKYFGFSIVNGLKTEKVEQIPVTTQKATVNGKEKTYYYFDFEQAVRDHKYDYTYFTDTDEDTNPRYIPTYPSTGSDAEKAEYEKNITKYADLLKKSFIKDYFDYFSFCVNKNSIMKLEYMGYEDDFDDDSYETLYAKPMAYASFEAKYKNDVDLTVLEKINDRLDDSCDSTDIADARKIINNNANELQNITCYDDFVSGQMVVPDKVTYTNNGTPVTLSNVDIYTSGAITRSGTVYDDAITTDKYEDIQYTLTINDNSVINSTLLGNHTETTDADGNVTITNLNNSNKTTTTGVLDFSENYREHYDVVKWALKDLNEDTSDYTFLRDTIASDAPEDEREAYITPLNYYLNFDKLGAYTIDSEGNMTGGVDVKPENLDLDQYKVWASSGNVTIKGADEITGIIIAKGDVFFSSEVTRFNGLIISGGKVYISTVNTGLSGIGATKLCRNIINECIAKASMYKPAVDMDGDDTVAIEANKQALNAITFLSLFKSYESIAEKAKNGELNPDETSKDITNIDYGDIVRYNNWVRNVD